MESDTKICRWQTSKEKPTLIVGAGRGGSLLIRQMLRSPEMGLEPVLAVDDDPQKENSP